MSHDKLNYLLEITQGAHGPMSRPLAPIAPKAATRREKIGGVAGFVATSGSSLINLTLNLILDVLGFETPPEQPGDGTETQVTKTKAVGSCNYQKGTLVKTNSPAMFQI